MSLVCYGDTFYIFAATANGGYAGWVTKNNPQNVTGIGVCYQGCGSGSTPISSPPVQFTIYPATPKTSSSVCDPQDTYDRFGYPVSNTDCPSYTGGISNNVQGKPIKVSDGEVFYIGYASTLTSPTWASDPSYIGLNITGNSHQYQTISQTRISTDSQNSQIGIQNVSGPNVNFLTYGNTTFNMNIPAASPSYQISCGGVDISASLFSAGASYSYNDNWASFILEYAYNQSSCQAIGIPLYFTLVPVGALIQNGSSYTSYATNNFSVYDMGKTALYTGTNFGCFNSKCYMGGGISYIYPDSASCNSVCITGNVGWACDSTSYQCTQGAYGPAFPYTTQDACLSACVASPPSGSGSGTGTGTGTGTAQPSPPTQMYGCVDGQCVAGSGSGYTFTSSDCDQECDTLDTSSSSSTNWWLISTIIVVILVIVLLVIVGIVLYKKNKKKGN